MFAQNSIIIIDVNVTPYDEYFIIDIDYDNSIVDQKDPSYVDTEYDLDILFSFFDASSNLVTTASVPSNLMDISIYFPTKNNDYHEKAYLTNAPKRHLLYIPDVSACSTGGIDLSTIKELNITATLTEKGVSYFTNVTTLLRINYSGSSYNGTTLNNTVTTSTGNISGISLTPVTSGVELHDIFTEDENCDGGGQKVYGLTYGGCPPLITGNWMYTHTWTDSQNATIPDFCPFDEWGSYYSGITAGSCTAIWSNVVAANSGSYTLTFTDGTNSSNGTKSEAITIASTSFDIVEQLCISPSGQVDFSINKEIYPVRNDEIVIDLLDGNETLISANVGNSFSLPGNGNYKVRISDGSLMPDGPSCTYISLAFNFPADAIPKPYEFDVCQNTPVILDAGPNKFSYEWRLVFKPVAESVDDFLGDTQVLTFTPTLPGNYKIQLTTFYGPLNMMKCTKIFEISTVTGPSVDYPNGYTVTGVDEKWTSDLRIVGEVIIPAGKMLTINNGAVIDFYNNDSKIIVEKGGKLIVDNATLRGPECLNSFNQFDIHWGGIEVEGDYNQAQPVGISNITTAQNTNSPDHGVLVLNNAYINDGEIGITLNGGLMVSEQGFFNNNDKAIVINGPSGILIPDFNRSIINNSDFTMDNQMGIVMYNTEMANALLGNRFTGTINGNAPSGVGIWSLFSKYRIGSTTNTYNSQAPDNTFKDLYKGIDAQGMNSLYNVVEIRGNLFENTERGITIVGHTLCDIKGNRLGLIPKSQDPTDLTGASDTYGVLMQGSTAYEIENNEFLTGITITGNTYGLVSISSDALLSTIMNNQFQGGFDAATQIEGVGSNVQTIALNCNAYKDASTNDWRIMSGSLVDQGSCSNNSILSMPSLNEWHSISSCITIPEININNLSGDGFTLTHFNAPLTTPSCISSDVTLVPCGVMGSNNCNTTVGAGMAYWLDADTNGDAMVSISEMETAIQANPSNAVYYNQLFSRLMQTRVDSGEYNLAKQLLIDENQIYGNKILLTSYISEDSLSKASNALNNLTLNNAADSAYYAVFDAVIGELQNSNFNISQTTQDTLYAISLSTHQEAAYYAQNYLSLWFDEIYNRSAAKPSQNNSKRNFNQNELSETVIKPNPAKDEIRFDLSEPANLKVFDLNGKLIQELKVNSGTLMNTDNLHSGLYLFCIVKDNGQQHTYKVMIIK